ncbi:hypothetical protein AVEN_167887-1 [Araneus ventricosus]|uniref:Uncharacterized protein n=1 Tax=Araneus ventricosus TaxID=182803 RepID=A0A4Y2UMX3_ARAVE|nr:hypothetical protein AVEN_167887-1 [Araneus ventricosus]
MLSLKQDIHEESAPSHLEHFPPDRSNFQSIYLGGSFTETPNRTTGLCIPRLLLLKSSKRDPPPRSNFRTHPSPRSTFCGFRFCERARSPSSGSYFSFMTQRAKWKMSEVGIPNFTPDYVDFSIDEGVSSEALQMA